MALSMAVLDVAVIHVGEFTDHSKPKEFKISRNRWVRGLTWSKILILKSSIMMDFFERELRDCSTACPQGSIHTNHTYSTKCRNNSTVLPTLFDKFSGAVSTLFEGLIKVLNLLISCACL